MKINTETKSKLFDGGLSIVLIFLMLFVFIILLIPFGKIEIPGYFIYAAICLAVSIFCLYRSMKNQQTNIQNAWFGITGGLAAWTVQEISGLVDWVALEDMEGLLLFVLMAASVFVLWQNLSTGPKFWFAMFLFNWGGHLLLKIQYRLCLTVNSIYCTTMTISAYLAGVVILGLFIWIFTKSKTRIARLWAANWIWLMFTIIVYAIKGW